MGLLNLKTDVMLKMQSRLVMVLLLVQVELLLNGLKDQALQDQMFVLMNVLNAVVKVILQENVLRLVVVVVHLIVLVVVVAVDIEGQGQEVGRGLADLPVIAHLPTTVMVAVGEGPIQEAAVHAEGPGLVTAMEEAAAVEGTGQAEDTVVAEEGQGLHPHPTRQDTHLVVVVEGTNEEERDQGLDHQQQQHPLQLDHQ